MPGIDQEDLSKAYVENFDKNLSKKLSLDFVDPYDLSSDQFAPEYSQKNYN